MHTEIFKHLMTSIRVYAIKHRLMGPEMVLPITMHILGPAQKKLNYKNYFLQDTFRDYFRAGPWTCSNHL